jgi:hypothetical protein
MALPPLPGWLIDYVTAEHILSGPSQKARNTIEAMCAAGSLKYCHCEEKDFKTNAIVRAVFYDAQKCKCKFDEEIVAAVSAFPDTLGPKRFNKTDHTAKMIVASALYYDFGIISSKSGMFVTPTELGVHHGLTCLTVGQLIALS